MNRGSMRPMIVKLRIILVLLVFLIIAEASISLAMDAVYVVNSYGRHSPSPHWSTVDMLNGSDLTVLRSVTVGYDAHNIAVDPNGSRLWVAARGSNNISIIDPVNLTILKDIRGDFMVTPLGVAITPDGERAYVAFESVGQVGVFDARTYAYLSSVFVDGHPSFIVITPDGKKVYVVDYLGARVVVIRASDNAVLASLTFRGHKLQDAVVSPDGSKVYVCNQDKNQIEVISTKDDSVLVPIPTADIYPRGIGISPDGAYLFFGVSSGVEGVVSMLRLSDDTIVSVEKTRGNARTILARPDGGRIFVADYDKDRCYSFDVNGESLIPASVVNLNAEPGFRAAPIGLAVIADLTLDSKAAVKEPQLSSGPTKAENLSSRSIDEKGSSPGMSAFSLAIALLVLLRFKRRRS